MVRTENSVTRDHCSLSDPRDRFFYPHHTPMKDTYNLSLDAMFYAFPNRHCFKRQVSILKCFLILVSRVGMNLLHGKPDVKIFYRFLTFSCFCQLDIAKKHFNRYTIVISEPVLLSTTVCCWQSSSDRH